MRRGLFRVASLVDGGTRVDLSAAGRHLATGVGAALATLFVKSPALKNALAQTAAGAFRSAAEELRKEREGKP